MIVIVFAATWLLEPAVFFSPRTPKSAPGAVLLFVLPSLHHCLAALEKESLGVLSDPLSVLGGDQSYGGLVPASSKQETYKVGSQLEVKGRALGKGKPRLIAGLHV